MPRVTTIVFAGAEDLNELYIVLMIRSRRRTVRPGIRTVDCRL